MSMKGIDIASYQSDMDVSKVDADFVIIKITQGDYYVNPSFAVQYDQARRSGKLVGMYHYSNGIEPVSIEVNQLLKHAKPYLENCLVCFDWESNGKTKRGGYNPMFVPGPTEVDYVYRFATLFNQKTGIWPVIYMSASVTRRSNWSIVAKNCPLWVAQYKNDNLTGYQETPWRDKKGLGAWKEAIIHQYSPSGTIRGYEQTSTHKLDMDIANIDRAKWIKYQIGGPVEVSKPITPELIQDVLDGKYGSGEERRKKLSNAGYSPMEVQAMVNQVLSAAKSIKYKKTELGEYWAAALNAVKNTT